MVPSLQSASEAPVLEAIVYDTFVATPVIAESETVIITLPSASSGLEADALPPLLFTALNSNVGLVSSFVIV